MDAETTERTEITILQPEGPDSLALGLSRTEIDVQIATARRYPRQLSRVSQNVLSLATLDEETAAECLYALPRGGKPIKGPSIRLAEIIQSQYGNCRVGARVVHVDRAEKVVIAEGIFHDLETNAATKAEVRRRIVDSKGRLYSDDMIVMTGNAACSIAKRNAILGGVPKALWRGAANAVEKLIAGDIMTLAAGRETAVKSFAQFGVKPEQVFVAIGVGGIVDITLDHIPVLRGMFSALKNGEATVEEMFNGTVAGKSNHTKVVNPLADSPQQPKGETPTQNETTKTLDMTSDKSEAGSAGKSPPVDPVELTVEYGQALERARSVRDINDVVNAFAPNFEKTTDAVRKVASGLEKSHRERVKAA